MSKLETDMTIAAKLRELSLAELRQVLEALCPAPPQGPAPPDRPHG